MNTLPHISDSWQSRFHRYTESLPTDDPLRLANQQLWRSFKEERRILSLVDGDTVTDVQVLSVQQGPTRTEVMYDWQHMTGGYSHLQRMLAAHASLRTALVEAEADRAIGMAQVNLRELTPDQIASLCTQICGWWEGTANTFIAPFSRMAGVMRNWLSGVYGSPPPVRPACLDPILDVDFGSRELFIETGLAIARLLKEEKLLLEEDSIAVIGMGAWAESLTVELNMREYHAIQHLEIPEDVEEDVMFLAGPGLHFDQEQARSAGVRVIAELVPECIAPEADAIVRKRGILVMPDLFCTSADDIVEDWWIRGRPRPDWQKMLADRLGEIWKEIRNIADNHQIGLYDAAAHLALENLCDRWKC